MENENDDDNNDDNELIDGSINIKTNNNLGQNSRRGKNIN